MTMAACWTVKGGQCVLVTAALLLLVFVNTSEAVTCLECNTNFKGQLRMACEAPRTVPHCAGCLKVVTKIQVHDGWLLRRSSSVETKYCARVSGNLLPEGCYVTPNNGGYTESCYCFTDKCNQATQLLPTSSLWIFLVVSLGLCLRKLIS